MLKDFQEKQICPQFYIHKKIIQQTKSENSHAEVCREEEISLESE